MDPIDPSLSAPGHHLTVTCQKLSDGSAWGLTEPGPADDRSVMRRTPHENAATVLVDPRALGDLEVELMTLDLRLWPIATAPNCVDGPRRAFQIRHRMITARRGAWDDAARWVPVWICFGESWRDGAEPLPWEARKALYRTLDRYARYERYRRGLGGIPRTDVPRELVG